MGCSPSATSDLKPFTARLADYLVLAKVRRALGFTRCRKNFYGAAPMDIETQHFFLGLNIRLYAAYGLSETSGPHFMSSPDNYRLNRYVHASNREGRLGGAPQQLTATGIEPAAGEGRAEGHLLCLKTCPACWLSQGLNLSVWTPFTPKPPVVPPQLQVPC